MRIEKFCAETPSAKNIVKARISAFSKEDAKKAANVLAKGWEHFTIKQIHNVAQPGRKAPELTSYYVLLWN